MNKAEKFLLVIFLVAMEGMAVGILRGPDSSSLGAAAWGLAAITAAWLFIIWHEED